MRALAHEALARKKGMADGPDEPPLIADASGVIPRRSATRPLRLVAQDIGLSRRKQGFESPRGRQRFCGATTHGIRL